MVAVLESTPQIRPMCAADILGVLRVEQSGYDYPWSRRIFEDCLRAGYCCLVAEVDERVEAHGIMMVRAGEAHILNICVDAGARRRGFARRMLDNLLEVARSAKADSAFLEVRRSNTGAIALYEGAGFHEVGRRPGYYPAPFGREDALVMARSLVSSQE